MNAPANSQIREFIFTAETREHAGEFLKALDRRGTFVAYDPVHGVGLSDGGIVVMVKVKNETLISMRWHARLIEGAALIVKTLAPADSYTGKPDDAITAPIPQQPFGLLEINAQ